MKKSLLALTLAAVGLFVAQPAQADTFVFNFCGFVGESSTCDEDHVDLLSEASLTFETVDGTLDPNDYTLTVRFVGTDPDVFLKAFDFAAGNEFDGLPSLTSDPLGNPADWDISFNKVSNGGGPGCGENPGNDKFACAEYTAGNGPDLDGTLEFEFDINLVGDGGGIDDSVNLRAIFVDSEGRKVGAILSPDSNFETTSPTVTTSPTETTSPTVTSGPTVGPEPASLSLLGLGLAFAAYYRRRRS